MKSIRKKLVALFMAMTMLFSMSMCVFAEETTATSEVTVSLEYYSQVFTETSMTETFVGYCETTVTVPTGSTVEDAVKAALSVTNWSDEDVTVAITSSSWTSAQDYYDPTVIHEALDSVTIDSVTYATNVQDNDSYWRGAGWTYSGTDGTGAQSTEFNTYNYMDDNYITQSTATIDLVYSGYSYSKA